MITNRRLVSLLISWGALAALFTLCIILLALLWLLPYSSAYIEHRPATEAERPPEGGAFRVGGIHWDVDLIARDPDLEPYRRVFVESCSGASGIDAAICLSDLSPFGSITVSRIANS